MKILYTLLILLVVYAIFVVVRFKYTLATAHLPEFEQQDQRMGQGPPLKYIAAGDSTAVGEGASSIEQSYTYRVAQFLSNSNTVEYKNVGVSGARTSDVIAQQLPAIVNFDPDVITLSIGANNMTHQTRAEKTFNDIQTILNELSMQTHATIYITNIPIVDRASLLPYPYRKLLEYQIRNINKKISALESDRVKVVDIHEFGWDQYPDIETTFAADKFHPNDEGYNNWTNAFTDRIRK
jgi:acyl-CoA thioesterase I